MEMELVVEMVPQKQTMNDKRGWERGENNCWKIYILFNIQNAQYFCVGLGEISLGTILFEGNFVSFLIPWPGLLQSNKILFFSLVFQMGENVNSCPSGDGAFSSPFLHVIMLEIYFFSKLKPLKPSNQNRLLSFTLYSDDQLLTFRNSFPKMKLWGVCMVIIIFTLVSTI